MELNSNNPPPTISPEKSYEDNTKQSYSFPKSKKTATRCLRGKTGPEYVVPGPQCGQDLIYGVENETALYKYFYCLAPRRDDSLPRAASSRRM
jgi:hypothetical protein